MREEFIDQIIIGSRFRKDLGDIDSLAKSIQEVGLLQPIGVTSDLHLIFGHRRLEAFKRLGRKTIPCTFLNPASMLQMEHDENEVRLSFSPTERVAIAQALRPAAKKAAEKRKQEHKKTAPGRRAADTSEIFSEVSECGEAEAQVAAAVGWSRPTLEKATQVVEAAREDPQTFGDLPDQMDKTGKVSGAHTEMKRRKSQVTPKKKPPPAATGKKVRTSITQIPAITLGEEIGADLYELTELWDCTPAAAVRRLISEKAAELRS